MSAKCPNMDIMVIIVAMFRSGSQEERDSITCSFSSVASLSFVFPQLEKFRVGGTLRPFIETGQHGFDPLPLLGRQIVLLARISGDVVEFDWLARAFRAELRGVHQQFTVSREDRLLARARTHHQDLLVRTLRTLRQHRQFEVASLHYFGGKFVDVLDSEIAVTDFGSLALDLALMLGICFGGEGH